VNVPVALSWASTAPVTAHYQTFSKSALAGRDYEATSGTLTFTPGQTLAHIPVTIDPDTQAGPNLLFTVKLSAAIGATTAAPLAVVTVVDQLGPITVGVDDPLASPVSSGFAMPFTVSLSSPVAQGRTVVVPYTTAAGSPGIDYTTTTGTLTFMPGQSSLQVLVPILDKSVPTARSFSLKLGRAVGVTPGKVAGQAIITPG
jgi:hypothetical protein